MSNIQLIYNLTNNYAHSLSTISCIRRLARFIWLVIQPLLHLYILEIQDINVLFWIDFETTQRHRDNRLRNNSTTPRWLLSAFLKKQYLITVASSFPSLVWFLVQVYVCECRFGFTQFNINNNILDHSICLKYCYIYRLTHTVKSTTFKIILLGVINDILITEMVNNVVPRPSEHFRFWTLSSRRRFYFPSWHIRNMGETIV